VFVQHPGSDASVWKGKPIGKRITAMKGAASPQNFMLRLKDIPVVLDQLEDWNTADGHALHGRMDLNRIGMSGHSFGAMTTQAISGQKKIYGNTSFTDSRINAAIIFSPSSPRGEDPKQIFGDVKIPWMLMTGTKDIAPIGTVDMASRLSVFPALPPGGKYELVLYGAEHSDFSNHSVSKTAKETTPHLHRAIVALSTNFWDTWLRKDVSARAWLHGDGPNSILKKKDRWQWK
jgi:predicted dienelactone hydrolase